MRATHCTKGHEFTPENTYVARKSGLRHCRICRKAYHKSHPVKYDPHKHQANKKKWTDKNPDYFRNHRLKQTYGLTPQQYQEMLTKQDGKCAVCEEKMTKVNIDHDHTTDKVRELLCTGCNTGIGSLREDMRILEKAIAYLRKHKES